MKDHLFIGIDVSKAKLDAAIRPGDQSFSVTNHQRGITALMKQLKTLNVSRIVLEASGGYEIAAASELAAAGLPVAVVNPRQVRDFARATGRLAKTDAIDARVLAHFAELIQSHDPALAGRAEPGTDGAGRTAATAYRNAHGREQSIWSRRGNA